MTEPSTLDAVGFAVRRLEAIPDPHERIRSAVAFRDGLGREDENLRRIIGDAVLALRADTPPWTWEQIGELMGVTKQRAQAIATEHLRRKEPTP